MTDHTTLTDAEREALIGAVLDDRDRADGYSVMGRPGGTDGQTPTLHETVERIVAEARAEARAEFAAECIRSIEAMATASQYGPHRRAGMRDAAHRVERIAREGADR